SSARVTQKKLESIPFVAESIWKHVHADGNTAAEVTLRFHGAKQGMGYYITLDPQGAAIDIPSIGPNTTNTHGHIVIDDGLVTLKDMNGQAAKGRIEASGKLDFRKDVSELHFDVKVRDA